jgi:orotidine-5'-phosphate decarboxylase
MFKSGRIVLALDGLGLQETLALVCVFGSCVSYKIHDLWDRQGPTVVKTLRDHGAADVVVDLKLHDIPKTVELRARAVKDSGASAVTVHASGGIEMMQAAVTAQDDNFSIIGITALTSLSEEQVHLTYGNPAKATVLNMAYWARLAGVRGLVCSPQEVGILGKKPELAGMYFMTPGVRSPGQDAADQKRIDTPAATIKAGSHFLVIGREVTKAGDPIAALDSIEKQIADALAKVV